MVRDKSGPRRKLDVPEPEDTVQREFATLVGDAIRRGRQAREWTQVELAEHAQLSANYIARLERGELGPSLFVAHRISRALGVDLNALLTPVRSAPPLRRAAAR